MQNDGLVRRWVSQSLPGPFNGTDHDECWRKAYQASQLSSAMALSYFADAMKRMGFAPKEVRPGLFRLSLPDRRSPGVRAKEYRYG